MSKYIEIVETSSGDVVHFVDVTDSSPRRVEKIEDGININLDHDNYFTRIAER